MRRRGWLLSLFRVLELSVEISVDTKRLHSLIVFDLGRALSLIRRMLGLSHAHE